MPSVTEKIDRIYKENNYPGLERLVKLVDKEHPEIFRYQVVKFLEQHVPSQLTKKVQKKKAVGHIVAFKPDEMWQIDLFDISRYWRNNDNHKYLFACVDGFTRKAYVKKMKNKDVETCISAFNEIINDSGHKPRSIVSDIDLAFNSTAFQNML